MMNGKDYKGMYMKRFGKFLPYSVLRTLYGEGEFVWLMKKCLETGRPYNKLTLADADSNQACEILYGIKFGERLCQPMPGAGSEEDWYQTIKRCIRTGKPYEAPDRNDPTIDY